MPPLWPAEVDVFSEPHTRMKKLVHKYSKMVSKTDFLDELHMMNLLQNLTNVFCEFKAHEEIENIHIMQKLKRKLKAACVTSAAVCNCHNDNRLTHMLEMVVNGSRSWSEKSVKERQTYGSNLQSALDDFTQKFIPHMEEEEEVFQPMLMKYFSYEELKELKAKVIQEHLVSPKPEKFVEDLCPRDKIVQPTEVSCFDSVPDEICQKIFSFLNPQELCRSAQVCQRFNRIAKDPALWRGIYPVHWAKGNWTFYPEPLGGVDGAGEFDEDLRAEFTCPVYHDEDADVDESSYYKDDDDKDCDDREESEKIMREVKILSALVKYLLPCAGSGVKIVDVAYCKGLGSSLVHKILKLCPNVEVLDLTHTQVGDSAFDEYGASTRQLRLRHLDLTNCPNISDQTLLSLVGMSVYETEIKWNGHGLLPHKYDFDPENEIAMSGSICCGQRSKECSKNFNHSPHSDDMSVSMYKTKNSSFQGDKVTEERTCANSSLNEIMKYKNHQASIPLVNGDITCCRLPQPDEKDEDHHLFTPSSRLSFCPPTTGETMGMHQSSKTNLHAAISKTCSDSQSGYQVSSEVSSLNNLHTNKTCCPDKGNALSTSHTAYEQNITRLYENNKLEEETNMFDDNSSCVSASDCPLSGLQYLSLNGCNLITDLGIRALADSGGTPSLLHLDLSGCIRLTGESIEHLVLTCSPDFDHANLFYCDNISSDPYPSTASGCRNLGCGTRFCCSMD